MFFNKDGVRVEDKKVIAICDMPDPKNITELKRFLGMVTPLGSYIDNLSLKTSNFPNLQRTLLSKNTNWYWSDKHDLEYNNLTSIISNAAVLTYYDQNKDIILIVDLSKNAMGAVISHDR